MDSSAAAVFAGIITLCIGGTILACVDAWRIHGPYGTGLPPCTCRCAAADHVQRFGPPGRCKRCRCIEYEPVFSPTTAHRPGRHT